MIDILLQTHAIMGHSVGKQEPAAADVAIQPKIGAIGSADFEHKHLVIREGEKAAQEALPLIRNRLRQWPRKD